MSNMKHTVLCVDDEQNILSALKRILRKEGYQLLTASSGVEGLEILKENDVHLVMSDQRMPQMSGTEFLARVKEEYPDTIRIILTGYTDVDSITESINRGHIYKFFLKPWNDQNLKLEIKKALEQYDLVQANKRLHETVLEQNEELKEINENLEMLVKERTGELEIQNQALELSRAILEDLPVPVIGVSSEGFIVMANQKVLTLFNGRGSIEIGKSIGRYFSEVIEKALSAVHSTNKSQSLKGYLLEDTSYNIELVPLSDRFNGKGVIMTLRPV